MATGQTQRTEFESPTAFKSVNIKPLVKPIAPSKVQPAKSQPIKAVPAILKVSQSVNPLDCALQPEANKSSRLRNSSNSMQRPLGPVELERFRRTLAANAIAPSDPSNLIRSAQSSYQPREAVFLIDPTNYGDRYVRDVNGNSALLPPLVVLHETVGSAGGTLNLFRTRHPNEKDQASYHTLIQRDGTVLYLVPPDKRAYGAGNSIFFGVNGVAEAVKTHPKFPPSVNNFSYHVALESPPDGNTNAPTHSGYTIQQYHSLAWVISKTGVPDTRITTHRAVDRSGQRMDPRNFSSSQFFQLMQSYTKTVEIPIGCVVPQVAYGLKQPIRQAKNASRPPQQKRAI
ncbi:N-acetylmuramoyl-L-alanine amidase [Phormidium sp. CLA17]|uniref:peptidoglycan recognition protein family protein n=1 Tax=Leptolyngbya sp. Cla-17 TaxID=2803751 RepID=UPI0018D7AE1F|nr:peptidoglycan recognition family protein [Leptolyngbya sp. Cla-17]MBM0740122.1 N-acetylmuramoyl-L-alanine amidase [Leptolyngbya sp. Cla-17]